MPDGLLSLGRAEMPSIDRNDDTFRSEQGDAKWMNNTTEGFPRQMLADSDTNSRNDAPSFRTYHTPAKSRNTLELTLHPSRGSHYGTNFSGNARTPKPERANSTRNHCFQTNSVISNLFYIMDRPFEASVVPGAVRHKTFNEPESTFDDIDELNAQRQKGL